MKACKGCGKRILWGIDEDGTTIPLDMTPPVYVPRGGEFREGMVVVDRHTRAYVSHFATCPQREQFSRKKTPRSQQEDSIS